MFIHDIIKIKYVTMGYLPNIPYHLISDTEMFNAFCRYGEDESDPYKPNEDQVSFLLDTYPYMPSTNDEYKYPASYYPNTDVLRGYDILVRSIFKHIDDYKCGNSDKLPNWVYGYMLGIVIGISSTSLDIHDIIEPLGVDTMDDDYSAEASIACYTESKRYLEQNILKSDMIADDNGAAVRPPTMYGEPHVIKSIRLSQVKL